MVPPDWAAAHIAVLQVNHHICALKKTADEFVQMPAIAVQVKSEFGSVGDDAFV